MKCSKVYEYRVARKGERQSRDIVASTPAEAVLEFCGSSGLSEGVFTVVELLNGVPTGTELFRVSPSEPEPPLLAAAYYTGPGLPFLDGEPPDDGRWYVVMDGENSPSLVRWNRQEGYFVDIQGREVEIGDIDIHCPFPVEAPK